MALSILEELCYCTTRIETKDKEGNLYSGTGFFYSFNVKDNKVVPLLCTNKHVIEGMTEITLTLTKADKEGNPLDLEHITVTLRNNQSDWIFFPDTNVDLCVLPIASIINHEIKNNTPVFYRTFDDSLIPSAEQIEKIDAIEDIIMIGYPNGLWDEVNNKPLVRKGVTATNFKYNYNGRKEFVIDAACFPGSSGSPVLICNVGSYHEKNGGINVGGNRIYLLGTLYAGPQLTVTGDLKVINIPTSQQQVLSVSHIPNNLGYVIKSERLKEVTKLLKNKFGLE